MMTTRELKDLASKWWWRVAAALLPFMLWGAKKYDASKLDERTFAVYVQQQAAAEQLRIVRDSARQEKISQQLRYLICREDFSRQQCLRPDR